MRDLVSIDEDAEFRSDVQLSDYEKPEVNSRLLHSYLFTLSAPQGQESSVGLLKMVCDAFVNPRLDNRIAVVANYGHGKSHLALVLANFFGKPPQSEECRTVLGKISKAVDVAAKAERFREFRASRPEFLVVRLRGDVPRSLREQFIAGVERALTEHESTRDLRLEVWHQEAENFLSRLSGDDLARANEYLETIGTEVEVLRGEVRSRSDKAYDICRNLSAFLYGVPLDFGGEASLRDVVSWLAKRLCGDGGPLGGILVLFDEFSLYVQRYAERNAAGELQDLLNGIEDQKGHALFLAFAQHDPVKWAKNVTGTSHGLDSLEKELTRIPKRVLLYSLMESVIDTYLCQQEDRWRELRSDQHIRGPLARASNMTLTRFSKRYEDTLRWDTERFDEIVTKGCFPLHPLTTALLCDLRLQVMSTAGNPRTVLGFVLERVAAMSDERALLGESRINWVLPVALVDYFGDYLPEVPRRLYENARRALPADASGDDESLLKALLLQEAAQLRVRGDDQLEFLAEAAGMRPEDARSHLAGLASARAVRVDSRTRVYSFWPSAEDPHRLEGLLKERLPEQPLTVELLAGLSKELQRIPVDVAWGHPNDWGAPQHVLVREYLEPKRLRGLIPAFQVGPNGELGDGERGCVIWLLGEVEEDVAWFRQSAANVLNESFPGESPPPCVLILPASPLPELTRAIRTRAVVEHLSQDERQEVGIFLYNNERDRQRRAVFEGLDELMGGLVQAASVPRAATDCVVPRPYQASVQAAGRQSLQRILLSCYQQAYRWSPQVFFGQYREAGRGQNKLRDAVRTVSAALLRNSLGSNRAAVQANPVARDLCEKFLLGGWELVTADFRVREPGNPRIRQAWQMLETVCQAGHKDVPFRKTLVTLLNPPYGYDANTATLLFCAWVGYSLQELELSLNGTVARVDDVADLLSGGGRQFLQRAVASQLRLSRRDRGQLEEDLRLLVEEASRSSLRQERAREVLAKLQAAGDADGLAESLVEAAGQAAKYLEETLAAAQDYDRRNKEIQSALDEERSVARLLPLEEKIAGLPRLGNVLQSEPSEERIRKRWLARVATSVEDECVRLENVERVTQIERNREHLESLRRQLKKAKLPELADRVGESLTKIASRAKLLEGVEREGPLRAELEAMSARADLATLYGYRNRLDEIIGVSDDTRRLRDERKASVDREIAQLESFASELVAAAERLDDPAAVLQWQQEFLRKVERYEGSPLQGQLEKAGERVDVLRLFFKELDDIAESEMATFNEGEEVLRRMDALKRQVGDALGDHQRTSLERKCRNIEGRIQKQVGETERWLDRVGEESDRPVELGVLRERLEKPPRFMSPDQVARWQVLVERLRERLDKDIVARIEADFRSIGDPEKRRECLRRLERALKEEGHSQSG